MVTVKISEHQEPAPTYRRPKTPTALAPRVVLRRTNEKTFKRENQKLSVALKELKIPHAVSHASSLQHFVNGKWVSISFAQHLDIERTGVSSDEFLGTIERLKMPSSRVFEFLKIPKSTAAYKIKNKARFEGMEALAILRIVKLLSKAESIIANSLHPDAKDFDVGKWLGEWIESPQPALGGIKPSELLDTEVGGNRVYQVLSALESGSYQ